MFIFLKNFPARVFGIFLQFMPADCTRVLAPVLVSCLAFERRSKELLANSAQPDAYVSHIENQVMRNSIVPALTNRDRAPVHPQSAALGKHIVDNFIMLVYILGARAITAQKDSLTADITKNTIADAIVLGMKIESDPVCP